MLFRKKRVRTYRQSGDWPGFFLSPIFVKECLRMFFQELSLRNEAEIFAVIRTAFAVPPWNDDWRDEASFHAYLVDILGNRNSLGLGLWDDGALIALALGRVKHWFDGIEYCIDDLCVRPDNQGRGVGSALLRHIREYACEKGFQRVSLSTNRTAPAYAFYRKNGFIEASERACMVMRCAPGPFPGA